ncbi:oligosaccharide flippase family protein [Acinetobacter radioresistens]|uniref:oligosaccharide flippase family protein n=1 Tax=Acinetobacter radioresistens TaxID=40216 RepID=UPI00200428A6|nr:oligosaccharide flippase family protein [Acinetobacter radioresistens]MCK4102784.1 oligosaccharide flippase family protein [Acinetobacter radioresistens]
MRVLKDSLIYLIGELINKALPFLLLPYLTRKLGAEGFGELSYYLTILALVSIFIGLSQEGAVTRYFYFYGNKALDLIVRTGYLYNIIFSFICLLFCWIWKSEILTYLVLISMFSSFLNVQLALRQCQKQPIPYIVIQLLSSFSMVILTIIFIEFFPGDKVASRLLAILVSTTLVFLVTYFFINNKFKIKKNFSLSNYKIGFIYLLTFGVPLILHQISIFIKGQVDRIFIYKYYDATDLGVYSAGVQIASILTVIFMAANKAIVPYYYEALKKKTLNIKKIKKYTLMSFFIVGLPAIICYFLPNTLFIWFLGPNFNEVQYYTVLFLIGYGLTLPYLLLVNFLFYNAKTKIISTITFINSIIYLGILLYTSKVSIQLIPYSLILSNLLMVLILWLVVGKIKEI